MKVLVTTAEGNDDNDWRSGYSVLVVTDKEPSVELNFNDGEPEDATLNRDFNDVYSIPDIIKMAYDAGRRGETFEIEEKVEE